jgi:thioredoxin 1
MRTTIYFRWAASLFLFIWLTPFLAMAEEFNAIPEKGMVTLIDLGAKKCIPCKMMAPILQKLEKAYDGKARIIFIDVWENRDQAKRFGIEGIPTQIFFDKEGKEVYRHGGFMAEEAIHKQLAAMGVEPPLQKNQAAPDASGLPPEKN